MDGGPRVMDRRPNGWRKLRAKVTNLEKNGFGIHEHIDVAHHDSELTA